MRESRGTQIIQYNVLAKEKGDTPRINVGPAFLKNLTCNKYASDNVS